MTTKEKTQFEVNRFCKLRDAIDFCQRMKIDTTNTPADMLPVQCCTCHRIKRIKSPKMQAGHWLSKGLGSSSGIKYNPRAIHAQCTTCNISKNGNREKYDEFMLTKYGQEVIDDLLRLHRSIEKWHNGELIALGQNYKDLYEELLKSI